ncbi:hypothetical protein WVIC16_130022 [Weissella viridescens]|nr:hypothetical protein WVIC16_130022 [Weissella viridescens]
MNSGQIVAFTLTTYANKGNM